MEDHKISIKIGDATLETTGSKEAVDERYKLFLEAIKIQGNQPPKPLDSPFAKTTPPGTPAVHNIEESVFAKAFKNHDEAGFVSLEIQPDKNKERDDRIMDALLLLLYGFDKVLKQDKVPVSLLSKGLAESGMGKFNRLGFVTDPLQKKNLIIKSGVAKGSKYSLNNLGRAEAIRLLGELTQHI